MSSKRRELVRELISENDYLTLATTDGERPWVAPVQYTADEHLNLYFVSLPTSRHAAHIEKNPAVGVAIFDSRQPPFTGRGLQVDGIATRYSETENPFATIGGLDMSSDLQEVVPGYVAYRIEPRHFYVPRGFLEGIVKDERVEIAMTP